MNNFFKLVISVALCESSGLLATPFTIAAIPVWYQALNKPSFSPPNWVFGPVWTLLYFMMGVSLYLVWKEGLKNKKTKAALVFFAIQLILNFLWSVVFFGLRSPEAALIEILVLWFAILFTTLRFNKISKTAACLLIPYLVWVSFATVLNASIVMLNR